MEIVIWVELASDVPLSGTVLDPVPVPVKKSIRMIFDIVILFYFIIWYA